MRVRTYVESPAGRDFDRAEVIEEDEGADPPVGLLYRREHPLHREAPMSRTRP